MEQTALRPKPMPGQEPGGGRPAAGTRRPHAARRRGRRLVTLLFGLFVGAVLVLSGVGLGTVGATVIGMSKLADLQKQAADAAPPSGSRSAPGTGSSIPAKEPEAKGSEAGESEAKGSEAGESREEQRPETESVRATLGVEAVDVPGDEGEGALVVGVHVPGPGHTAGLVRGDILLAYGETRVDGAADLARAVAAARPGTAATLTVRHADGTRQQLSATPGFVT
ncbi:PDZ domain-containing protein [Streptomyces sp. NPDC088747]|uniref:PDZ domain-containing protein n=1 Tax=Streptomyces sp. NPDC088747 TaxID=3365886 RepID=UPI0037F75E30